MDATMLEKLENEQAHSKFLEKLLEALYGKGWDKLTIPEAQKHHKKVAKLEGFLKYMVERYADDFCDFPEDGIQIEISDYIKEMEGK